MDLLKALLEDLEGQKQKRADFLKKTYESKWSGLSGFENIDEFLERLGEIDPTKNGAYMQWLAKLAIKDPKENKTEDLDRVKGDLETFEANKGKIEKKDINAFKSYQELYMAVEQFYQKREKTADEKKADKKIEKLMKAKGDIVIVYEGPEGWIRIPTTCEAAKFLGQSTRWCTAARRGNQFDYYNKRDVLFVVYVKSSKQRFQLHIDSGQFADEKDTHVGVDKAPGWVWAPIVDWYKKNNPNISLKQMMSLSTKAGGEDLVKGTDHEELFDLMKKYGI